MHRAQPLREKSHSDANHASCIPLGKLRSLSMFAKTEYLKQLNQTRVPMYIKINLLNGDVEMQCTVTVRPKRCKIQVSLDEPSSVWSVTFQPQQN